LETTRNAELDSENVIKGELEAPEIVKAENVASDTLRAGDRISEIISSGMLFAMFLVNARLQPQGEDCFAPEETM
jgi:hypothetical protein